MGTSTALLELELTQPFQPQGDLPGREATVLCRLHGRPIGFVRAPVEQGRLSYRQLTRELLETRIRELAIPMAERAIATSRLPCWPDASSLLLTNPNRTPSGPTVDLVPLDGSPSPDVLDQIRAGYSGDVVAFVDAASMLDAGWLNAVLGVFLADPEVMVVTGTTLSRRRGPVTPGATTFRRRWDRRQGLPSITSNMAIWRTLLDDPERTHTAVHEPAALAWRRGLIAGEEAPREVHAGSEAIRHVDLGAPLRPITDAADADRLRLIVSWEGRPVGTAVILHRGAIVSPLWITDAVAGQLTAEVLDTQTQLGPTVFWSTLVATFARELMPKANAADREPAADVCRPSLRAVEAA